MAAAQPLAPEFLKPWVRASVIDLRRPGPPIDTRYLIDTNVLYFLHYDRFDSLQALGEGPRSYQLQYYPQFVKTLRQRRVDVFVHRLGLLEFARVVERAELYVLYAIKTPDIGDTLPPDLDLKTLRKAYPGDYATCQQKVATLLSSLRKNYIAVPAEARDPESFWAHWCSVWPKSIADTADVAQIVDAQASGIGSVVSDDSDWVSCPEMRVFTANAVVVEAARLAGRLVT